MKFRTVTLEQHDSDVARVARSCATARARARCPYAKRSQAHQVPEPGDRKYSDDKIDVSCLNRILSIDVPCARPNRGVTFIDLVLATPPRGLVPMVVPEFKTITIGGAVSGCSIESMSFRLAMADSTNSCIEYDVITSAGEAALLHTRQRPEPCLSFDPRLLRHTRNWIEAQVQARSGQAHRPRGVRTPHRCGIYWASIRAHAEKLDVDFMDGIIHSPNLYVLSLGYFMDSAPYTHTYNWVTAYHETTAMRSEDYLRTTDYFFRYDRGVTNVHPKSKLGRLLIGPFMSSSNLLSIAEKIHWALPKKNPMVMVDLFIPISRFHDFMTGTGRSSARQLVVRTLPSGPALRLALRPVLQRSPGRHVRGPCDLRLPAPRWTELLPDDRGEAP